MNIMLLDWAYWGQFAYAPKYNVYWFSSRKIISGEDRSSTFTQGFLLLKL